MSENEQTSFMQREDWLVLLTGGLISSGAIGWFLHGSLKSRQLEYKPIMAIAASFVGGIYFTNAALVYMCRSKKDASNSAALDRGNSICERFTNVVNELDRKFALEASKAWECKELDKKTFMNNIHEAPCKSEDAIKKLNDFNQKGSENGLQLPTDNQIATRRNESIGSQKAEFREEILSCMNELKGYVQGALDPLPSAKNILFRSTEMSDEMRRQVVIIVKEYTNSIILPKLEQVIDEFVDSVCKAAKGLEYEKKYKVKKSFETLGVSEKDLSTALLEVEMNQYYNALEKTKVESRMQSCQNYLRYKNALGVNMQPLESLSSPSSDEKNTRMKTSELLLPVKPKLATATSASLYMPKAKPGNYAVGNRKNPPQKLILNHKQMNFLNLLKSELYI